MRGKKIVGCAELAPLSAQVAEVRSLAVDAKERGNGVGSMLVDELRRRAHEEGFDKLSAFTHAPGYFSQMGFSIVPHVWMPEKIFTDCVKCPMLQSLRAVRDGRSARRQPPPSSHCRPCSSPATHDGLWQHDQRDHVPAASRRRSGFRAAGISAGIKATKKLDLALIVSDTPATAAADVHASTRCRPRRSSCRKEHLAEVRRRGSRRSS